jgi:hypothetical protein
MAKTQLEVIAEKLRTQEVVINRYSEKNGYGTTNKNALSDGDELGKGQAGDTGTIGSLTDINTRIQVTSINKYNSENGYGITNPNAMSDGDEFGKGQIGDDGQIGSLTDINTRIQVINKNKFGESNKYPDFQ